MGDEQDKPQKKPDDILKEVAETEKLLKKAADILKKFGDKADAIENALNKDKALIKSWRAYSNAAMKDKKALIESFENMFNKKLDTLLERNEIKLNGADKQAIAKHFHVHFEEEQVFAKAREDTQIKAAAAAAAKVGMMLSPTPLHGLPLLLPKQKKKLPIIPGGNGQDR